MAACRSCGKPKGFLEGGEGLCQGCYTAYLGKSVEQRVAEELVVQEQVVHLQQLAKGLVVTTETFVGDVERLNVVATEVVLGMNIFKDVLANVRDIFGGRSGTVQNTLEEARLIAFEDLRMKAAKLGADAVIAVDIDYNSISTGSGINMMMVSVSGTAIRWKSTS